MAAERLIYNDVADAALTLLKSGKNPSAAAVSNYLGRGSMTTVHKHLTAWRQSLSDPQNVLGEQLPSGLSAPVQEFFKGCMGVARQELEEFRANAEKNIESAKEDVAFLLEEKRDLEERLKDRSHDVELAWAEADKRSQALVSLEESATSTEARLSDENKDLKQQILSLSEANSELHRSLTLEKERSQQARKEYERQLSAIQTEFEMLKTESEKRLEQMEKKWESDLSKSEGQLDHWMMEVDKQREHLKLVEKRAEERENRLTGEVTLQSKKLDAKSIEVSRLTMALEQKETEYEELGKHCQFLEASLSEFTE
jgi:chromosome segregation ATPase